MAGLSTHRSDFTPTDALRGEVVCYLLNGVSHDRIARILGLTLAELRYHFRPELDFGVDRVLALQAATVLELSRQRLDRGVALRAAFATLEPRVKDWREASVEQKVAAGEINDLTLAEIDAEIARLEAELAASRTASDEAEG